ncbi:toll/interleukin-1 receptor domain-containing protein [Paenibacillus cremeus]|uniref:Toll/interleukin-1 receptor domain-containing protein n=1 Tax=Paenibacillus cremeus TaxID=2163881 RepID=A0A559K5D4_9BACL|nr:toll/interleukin-1 receptor domain-containing protein [Paenibacillus cremeus]TVY07344.1 toll/interleukin-1 receptor domain-containing protein [Paenibacillus cremeus]
MATRGKNFAIRNSYGLYETASNNTTGKSICIFLSHISVDKDAAIKIGDYIMNAGYNVYLDIYDEELQRAVERNDAARITSSIEKGISNSSHVMCIVSEKTKFSWWVPYEVGYGKKADKHLSTLSLKDVTYLPSFLVIVHAIEGVVGLNRYLNSIRSGSTNYEYLLETASSTHALNGQLKTDR